MSASIIPSNQKKLSSSQQQAVAEAIFMSIGDGAIATNEFGKITRVNPGALAILGYQESDLLGEWFPKKIVAVTGDNEPINLIDRPITKAFLTGKAISEKTFYRKKNGQTLPVWINISPILLDNKPLGAIEVFRDITLEEEVDRMKSEFISLASHQLRTPLSAIKTYSHMLVDGYMGEVTPGQRKSLKTIISATNRMNELISTLLNITRIESGTIAVAPKLVYMDKLTEEVIKELTLMAENNGVTLNMECSDPDKTGIRTDSLMVKEILTNLVSNSLKYTPESGAVTVLINPRSADIHITVKDNGWGIPTYAQDQIFSKFFRAHNIVKRETTGTGLGLYLVKGLLEQLGGTIWFDSIEGKGTSFYFTLPRSRRRITKATAI
jgi:PAS domain S-box-containing protein